MDSHIEHWEKGWQQVLKLPKDTCNEYRENIQKLKKYKTKQTNKQNPKPPKPTTKSSKTCAL